MADIAAVLKELQQERGRLDQAIEALGKLVGQNHRGPIHRAKGPRRRPKMSLAARRKIAAAQRARWAKWKKQQKAA